MRPAFSSGNIEKVYTNAEAHNLLLPLDHAETHFLLVEIPEHFKYIFYEGTDDKITLQYIPKSDKLKKWSQIITVLVIPPQDEFEKGISDALSEIPFHHQPSIHFHNKEWRKTAHLSYETLDSRGKEKGFEAYEGKGYQGEQALYIVHYGFRHDSGSSIKDMTRYKKKSSSFINRLKIVKP